MAFEKLDVPAAVAELSLKQAAEVGAVAGVIAMRDLRDYSGTDGIFTKAQVEEFSRVKSIEAADKFLAERIAGGHNDTESRRPGLTVLLRSHAIAKIDSVLDLHKDLFGISIEEAPDVDPPGRLHIMRVPQGGYEEKTNALVLTDIVEPFGADRVRPTSTSSTSVRLLMSHVVTIAGSDGGEYWQNPYLNIDGTNREA